MFWANFYQIKVKAMTSNSCQLLSDDEKLWWISQNNSQSKLDNHEWLRIRISGKTNVLLNIITHQRPYIDFIKLKYQLLTNWREKVGTEKSKNLKAFIDHSQTVDDVCENFEDWNLTKKRKVFVVFDKLDMEANKKPVVTDLFLRGRKLNISLAFIWQSYFRVSTTQHFTCFYFTVLFQSVKTIRLNVTHHENI